MRTTALLLLATAALAGPLEDGVALYEAGDFEAALPPLREAAAVLAPGPERARALLFAGLTEAVLGRRDVARQRFAEALTDDPEVAPDRQRVPPPIVEVFEGVRARLRGRLEVTASRPAAVSLDGEPAGETPLSTELVVGPHALRVDPLDGGAPSPEQSVVVRAGDTVRVEIELAPLAVVVAPLPDPPDWYARTGTWAWVTMGVGVFAAAGGVALGLAARDAEADLHDRAGAGTLDYDQQRDLTDSAEGRASSANLMFGLAGTAALTSAVLFVFD